MTLVNYAANVYGMLLRLYPAEFRSDYADEMCHIFALTLRDASRRGQASIFALLAQECAGLIMNAIAQQLKTQPTPNTKFQRARFVTRGASLLLNLFFGWVLILILMDSETLYPGSGGVWAQAFPFLFALPIANLMMLVAWRWERLGGWLTIAGGIAVMLTSAYSLIITGRLMSMDTQLMIPALIANALWLLPHLLFGMLFLSFDRQGRRGAVVGV